MRILKKLGGEYIIQFLKDYDVNEDILRYFVQNNFMKIYNSKIVFRFLEEKLGLIVELKESLNYKQYHQVIYHFVNHEVYLLHKANFIWEQVLPKKIEIFQFVSKEKETNENDGYDDALFYAGDDDPLPF